MTDKPDRSIVMLPINNDYNASNKLKFGIICQMREAPSSGGLGTGEQVALEDNEPLTSAISQVCTTWGFTDPSIFSLLNTEGKYVTEDMRKDLMGKLVFLVYSPEKVIADIEERLKIPSTMEQGLTDLVGKLNDPVVADVFAGRAHAGGGLAILTDIIATDKVGPKDKALANAFRALADTVINTNLDCWNFIDDVVYSKIINYVNDTKKPVEERHALLDAYAFLEHAITDGPAFPILETKLSFNTVIVNFNHPDAKVHLNALALLNSLLSKAEGATRASYENFLTQQVYRELIVGITHGRKAKPNDLKEKEIQKEIRKHLYRLQCYRLRGLDDLRCTPVDPNDEKAQEHIITLTTTAFDFGDGLGNDWVAGYNSMRKDKMDKSKDYKKLGFQNLENPIMDFAETPPGILALECMHYLAKEQPETYNKIIVDSLTTVKGIADECPFAKSSIWLTEILCQVLRVGEPIDESKGKYWPFFFQHYKPFEDIFCVCAQLMTKTWREMRATDEDFDKVFDVVRKQIQLSLTEVSEDSLDSTDFRKLVNGYTYERINVLRQREIQNEDNDGLQTKPIQQLKKHLTPSMTELVKQNRLNFLMTGTRFSKVTSKILPKQKQKYWFCRLGPNHKVLHYGDCDEKGTPTIEELKEKVSVSDIKGLFIGKDCPHMKEKKKWNQAACAFSLIKERDPLDTIDFVAPDDKTHKLWLDGINALLDQPMTSSEAQGDLSILLDMEVKIRRLDIELIPDIPQEPPAIPAPPDNFDFSSFI